MGVNYLNSLIQITDEPLPSPALLQDTALQRQAGPQGRFPQERGKKEGEFGSNLEDKEACISCKVSHMRHRVP